MTPEGKVKKKIKELLDAYGVYYFMPRGTAFGRAGVPDFICCYRGLFLAIEAKAGKGTLTALQRRELQAIAMQGGWTLVINEDNMHELIMYLDKYKILIWERR